MLLFKYEKKFFTVGWLLPWLVVAFILMLPLSILLTVFLPKDDNCFITIILLWAATAAIAIAIVFGAQQATEINEKGILQKNPFEKNIF